MVSIANTTLAAVLDNVPTAPTPSAEAPKVSRRNRSVKPVDPVKCAEQAQKTLLDRKHSAKIQPAAREVKKAKAAKPANANVAEIKLACSSLGFIAKEWNGGDSFVVKLPSVSAFLKALPKDGATNEARLFIHLSKTIADFTKGDSKATWVFHKSGSFALYSELD